jgi:hypothetical protein
MTLSVYSRGDKQQLCAKYKVVCCSHGLTADEVAGPVSVTSCINTTFITFSISSEMWCLVLTLAANTCLVQKSGRQDNLMYFGKAVPLHAMEALGGRGGIAPTHSRPRH